MKLYSTGIELYVAESGRVRTEQSEITIRKIMRTLQSQWPDQHLEDFTTDQLTWYCLNRHDGQEGRPAAKTISQRKSYMRSTFKWFNMRKLIPTNPAEPLTDTVVAGRARVRDGVWLDRREIQAIYGSFDVTDQVARRNRLIFLFGVSTGLRVHELAQLTWRGHIAPDFSWVKVMGKGRQPATLALPKQLQEALREWRKEAPLGPVAVFPSVKVRYRFETARREKILLWDEPLGPDGVRYAVRAAGDALGVRLNPHDLRRSLAGILDADGVDVRHIQAALRHEKLVTTDGYLEDNSPTRQRRVAEGLAFEL